jgi:hypothetical protein
MFNQLSKAWAADALTVVGCTLFQCLWLSLWLSPKVGLVNLLPALLFLGLWYFFIKTTYSAQRFWLYFLPALGLTLRLPVVWSMWLVPLNGLLFGWLVVLLFKPIVAYFNRQKQVFLFVVTAVIVLFNTLGHVSLNSPYTYTFRTANHLASDYQGVDNNTTWECPYEQRFYAVNCDMRHFVASETIFTNPDPQAVGFSVLLSRFWYGYLNSLIGFSGLRWLASLVVNDGLWLLACVAIYRVCHLAQLGQTIAELSLLCAASSWGFIHFVGQPSPHVAAYAYSAYALWATFEILGTQALNPLDPYTLRRRTLLAALIATGALAYQVYPVTLACLGVLLCYRQWVIAIGIAIAQGVCSTVWKEISLKLFLGTVGAVDHQSSGSQNILYDFKTWLGVLQTFDVPKAFALFSKASLAYFYGSFGVGCIAALVFMGWLWRQNADSKKLMPQLASQLTPNSLDTSAFFKQSGAHILLLTSVSLCVLTFAATLFIVPQMAIWSPASGMQPRLSYFAYAINLIAIAAIATRYLPAYWRYAPALITFIVSNIDVAGLTSVAMLFDFGNWGWYWK